MARASTVFVCSACGATSSKWSGRCEACGAWNTIHEERATSGPPAKALDRNKGRTVPLTDLSHSEAPPPRKASGMGELDRVPAHGQIEQDGVALGDLDNDGDLDAFVVNSGFYIKNNKVWLNNGNGSFVQKSSYD